MIRRRRVLKSVVGTGVIGTAGCSSTPGDLEDEPGTQDSTGHSTADHSPTRDSSSGVFSNWPTLFGDGANSNAQTGVDPPSESMSIDWGRNLTWTRSAPIVARDAVVAATPTGIEAFEVQSGDERWSFRTESEVEYKYLAGGDDTVFVTDEIKLYAVDLDTGEPHWTSAFSHSLGSSMTALTSEFVFVAGLYPDNESIHAFERSSGEKLWTVTPGGFFALRDGSLFVEAAPSRRTASTEVPGSLKRLDTASGETRWSRDQAYNRGIPLLVDDVVVSYQNNTVRGCAVADGSEQWSFEPDIIQGPPSAPSSFPGMAGDRGYLVWAHGSAAYRIDAATGDSMAFRPQPRSTTSFPVILDDTVYIVNGARITATGLESGEEEWRHGMDFTVVSPPAITDERLIVRSREGIHVLR